MNLSPSQKQIIIETLLEKYQNPETEEKRKRQCKALIELFSLSLESQLAAISVKSENKKLFEL